MGNEKRLATPKQLEYIERLCLANGATVDRELGDACKAPRLSPSIEIERHRTSTSGLRADGKRSGLLMQTRIAGQSVTR